MTVFSLSGAAGDFGDLRRFHLVNGCQLFSITGEVFARFPGVICVFLDDGSFVSASDTHIRHFSKDDEVLWEHRGHFHHQVNLSADRKRLLALSSEFDGKTRQDKFLVFDLAGRVLHTQTTLPLLRQAGISPLRYNIRVPVGGADVEVSHFHSFYEIPKLAAAELPEYLREGNVIVNSLELGVFVLTPDLRTVLFRTTFPTSYLHRVHDVQVTPAGNFLYFNNVAAANQPKSGPITPLANQYSTVNEARPRGHELVRTFEASPREVFFSWISSNVQRLTDDLWLFTHHLNGTYVYSHAKKNLILFVPGTHFQESGFAPVQQVRAEDLGGFLRARKL
jgi:hypothetical protein